METASDKKDRAKLRCAETVAAQAALAADAWEMNSSICKELFFILSSIALKKNFMYNKIRYLDNDRKYLLLSQNKFEFITQPSFNNEKFTGSGSAGMAYMVQQGKLSNKTFGFVLLHYKVSATEKFDGSADWQNAVCLNSKSDFK